MRNFERHKRRLFTGAAFLLFSAAAYAQTDLAEQSHQAKQLMAEGRFEEAITIYQKLVAAIPGNPGFILNLGIAEQMAGHPRQAIPRFETVLRTQPNSVPALTSLGMAELQLNQPRLAVTPLEKLLRVQPDDVNARGMLAGAYMSLNRAPEAAEQYRRLTTADASDPKAWYGLGKAYEMLAAQTFRELSKDDPQSPYVSALLADSRFQRKQYRSAFFFYREAEAKLPDLPGLHAGLAKVYEQTGHSDWATAEVKAEENRHAPSCAVPNAECRFLNGDYLGATKSVAAEETPANLFWATRAYNQLAIRAFDQLGKFPDSVEIHALKAEILHGHGQDSEAAAEWRSALQLAPGDPHLQAELATSLFLSHKYDDVTPMLAEMLPHQPDAPDLNFMMGESLWHTQQAERALPYLMKALQADPTMLPAHAASGMVLVLLNRNDEAIPHLEKALSLDDDGSLHYSLARAYQTAGKTDQARKAMQQYQQIRAKNQEVNDELAKESEITPPSTR
ncbi:MAG: tetratricopeptide repeat protein [Acidobacteriota bacterium]|nr:tetratricopeptide repeat protein [Acidobacteriota bacterium]